MRRKRESQEQFWITTTTTNGGVDTADVMLRSYSTEAASRRWHLAAFFNLLNIVALNIHIIPKNISLSGQNRHKFSIKFGKELCGPEWSRRNKVPHLLQLKRVRAAGDEHLPLNKRTNCRTCRSNITRTKCGNCSHYVCSKCSTPICKEYVKLE